MGAGTWLVSLSSCLTVAFVMASESAYPAREAERFLFNDDFDDAIATAAKDLGIRLDPEVATQMKTDAGRFVFNFCSPETITQHESECRRGLGNSDTRRSLLRAFLADVLSEDDEVETVASRLAHQARTEIELTGWPAKVGRLPVGTVRLPNSIPVQTVWLSSATGQHELIGDGTLLVLMNGAKSLTLVRKDGSEENAHIEIAAAREAMWPAPSSSPSESTAISLPPTVGRIEVPDSLFCRQKMPTLAPALHTFNSGREIIAESEEERLAHMLPIALQPAIEIHVKDEAGECDDACERGLGIAFARAIAVWRAGCERCRPDALTSIRVGDNVWLDQRAMMRLRNHSTYGSSLALDALSEQDRMMRAAPSLSVPLTSIVEYEEVPPKSTSARTLCAAASNAAWVVAAQRMRCGTSSGGAEPTVSPTLELRRTPTDCGPEAIACGKPDGWVQLSTQNYAYSIETPDGRIELGDSHLLLDAAPVVLHEVGHWFGVPHPETVDVEVHDVMRGVLDLKTACVSAASLRMLNNAADRRWEFRAGGYQSLLPPIEVPGR